MKHTVAFAAVTITPSHIHVLNNARQHESTQRAHLVVEVVLAIERRELRALVAIATAPVSDSRVPSAYERSGALCKRGAANAALESRASAGAILETYSSSLVMVSSSSLSLGQSSGSSYTLFVSGFQTRWKGATSECGAVYSSVVRCNRAAEAGAGV